MRMRGGGGIFGALLVVSAPLAANAAVLIADGVTHTVSGTGNAGDDFDTDYQAGAGGGVLEIDSSGDLIFDASRSVLNTYGEGTVRIIGSLTQAASSSSQINSDVQLQPGGVIRSESSSLLLRGGGTYAIGGVLNAAGGSIVFNGGKHTLNGIDLTGSEYARVQSGEVFIGASVGAVSGAASGGYAIEGGTVTGLAAIGGNLFGHLSAERGIFDGGTLDGAVLRFTGTSGKLGGSTLAIRSGTLISEGTMNQDGGIFDLDPAGSATSGSLVNKGIWNLASTSVVKSTEGEGIFTNSGLLNLPAGVAIFSAKISNVSGGEVRVFGGATLAVRGGGSYGTGSSLNADGGAIALEAGSHLFAGGQIAGAAEVGLGSLFSSATASILVPVGPLSGAATGGFSLVNGTIVGLGALGGGGSAAVLSADHGTLVAGTIWDARYTGSATKAINSVVLLASGEIVNDGDLTQLDGGHFDVDPFVTAGAGSLVNHGTWTITGNSLIFNTNGGGEFVNEGTVVHDGSNAVSHVAAEFSNMPAGELRATNGSAIHLDGGGIYQAGSLLNADGGAIYLDGGNHLMSGCAISGSGYVHAGSFGQTAILAAVGPLSGPASGGFAITGGEVIKLGVALGSPGAGTLSADHGKLAAGTVNGAILSFTGDSVKETDTTLLINSGKLINEGVLDQKTNGNIDLDFVDGDGLAGTIVNSGTWKMEGMAGGCAINNTHQEGEFRNSGTLIQSTGSNTIRAAFHHEHGAVIRALAGQVYLEGGGIYESGCVLDADGGVNVAGGFVFLNGGTHEFNGGSLTGTGLTGGVGHLYLSVAF